MSKKHITRRRFMISASAAAAAVAAPAVLHAQTATLKTTAWGGKWGEVMKADIIPAFEKEFKCRVETDSAFPYYPKLQATPRNAPLYDVLQRFFNRRGRIDRERLVPQDREEHHANGVVVFNDQDPRLFVVLHALE